MDSTDYCLFCGASRAEIEDYGLSCHGKPRWQGYASWLSRRGVTDRPWQLLAAKAAMGPQQPASSYQWQGTATWSPVAQTISVTTTQPAPWTLAPYVMPEKGST